MTREPLTPRSSLNSSPDDHTLIRQTLAGQKSAFDSLVTRYRDRIFALAYHMLLNSQEAEDVAQEVFVRAYLNLKKFREEAGFFTWLYRIAVNAVYTAAKKASRRRVLYIDGQENDAWQPTMGESPETLAQSHETQDTVLRAIRKLEPHYRQVLVLKELEGFEVTEVGRMLGLPEGTVKSRLFRAREELRKILRISHKPPEEERA